MGWLWLLLGLVMGLILGVAIARLVAGRRHYAAPSSPPVSRPRTDPGYDEAVWALQAAERRLSVSDARRLAAEARLAEAARHAEATEDGLDDLRDDLELRTREADGLRRERDEAETRVAELETDLAAERGITEDLRRALTDAETSTAEGRQDALRRVADLDEALASARERAEATAAAAAAAEARAHSEAQRADRAESEMAAALAESERLRSMVRRFEEESQRIRSLHAEVEAEAVALRKRSADYRRRLSALEDEHASVASDAQRAHARSTELRAIVDGLEEDRRLAVERADAAEKELEGLEAVVVALTRERAARADAVRADQAERVRIATLEQRLETVEAARRASVERLTGDLEAARRSALASDERAAIISELEDRLARERTRSRTAEDAAEDLARRAGALESRLLATTDELGELDALRTRVESLRGSLADARSALVDIAGGPAAAEIERLRNALRVERERNLRLGTRLSGSPDEVLLMRINELEDVIGRLEVAGPDDLTLVRGIGPAIRDLLAEEGITTFARLASIDEATLERIRERVPVYPERIERDGWIRQAEALAARRRRT